MILTGMMHGSIPAAVPGNGRVTASTRPRTGQAAALPPGRDPYSHIGEGNVRVDPLAAQVGPTVNQITRKGFDGLRAVTQTLVRAGIPGLAGGPPQVITKGPGIPRQGRTPKAVTNASVAVPAMSAAFVPDWWTWLS